MAYNNKAGVIVPFAQKFYKQMIVVIAGLFIASMAAMTFSANAETLPVINFESFNAAVNLDGQEGWSKTGNFDVKVVNNVGAPTSFGVQSLRISNAITSGSFGDQTFSKSLVDEAGETSAINSQFSGGIRQAHFEAQFALASAVPGSVQSGLVMSVSPDRGDGARMSYLRFEDKLGGIEVYFDDYVASDFQETLIATLDRNISHTFKFYMNFVDGSANDVVKVYIDGSLEHVGTSWEEYFRENQPSIAPPTVDSLLFRTGGTAAPATAGKGFLIDNLTLTSGPVIPVVLGSKAECKKDGWKLSELPVFKNQGQCVSSFVKNPKSVR